MLDFIASVLHSLLCKQGKAPFGAPSLFGSLIREGSAGASPSQARKLQPRGALFETGHIR